jgi:hypothetical protein
MSTLAGLLGFSRTLAAAGVSVNTHRNGAFIAALEHLDLTDPAQFYWAGRCTLCAEPDDIPVYDRVFTSWFDRPPPSASVPSTTHQTRPLSIATMTGDDQATEQGVHLAVAASDEEVLRHKDLAELTDAERRQLRTMFTALDTRPPMRRGSRYRASAHGVADARRTLRKMLSTAEVATLQRHSRAPRRRRVVLLIDVSGSMSPYADSLLRFAHAVTRGAPTTTETFTFSTRLTRVSTALRLRDPEEAVDAAGRSVPDWAGGTRIGEGIKAFTDRWGQQGVARRAVVVVFSDGWERGDATLLGEQMARLDRLAHKVFWVNPHAGKDGYAPVQSGIAAALPHLHELLAGHTLSTLETLLTEVRDA